MVSRLREKTCGGEIPPVASAIHCCDFHTTIVEVFTRYDRISALNRGAKSVFKADKAATAAAAKDMELDTPVDESVASLVQASVEKSNRNLRGQVSSQQKEIMSLKSLVSALSEQVNDKADQAGDPVGQSNAPQSRGKSKRNRSREGGRGGQGATRGGGNAGKNPRKGGAPPSKKNKPAK